MYEGNELVDEWTNGPTVDPVEVASGRFDEGEDPAQLATWLREVSPEYEQRFVNDVWAPSEAEERPPMTAEEYQRNQLADATAERARVETLAQMAAEREQADQHSQHQQAIAEAAQGFIDANPRLQDPEFVSLMQSYTLPLDQAPTPEAAQTMLAAGYATALQADKALRTAKAEHDAWTVFEDRESVPGFMGSEGLPRPTLEELQRKYLVEIDAAKRADGSLKILPSDGGIAATAAAFEETARRFAGFDTGVARAALLGTHKNGETGVERTERMTGYKPDVPAALVVDDGSFYATGSHDHAREQAIKDGWSL